MVTFTCPTCHQVRTGARRRCYPCTTNPPSAEGREVIRQKLKGVRHSDERRRRNSEARRQQNADGHRNFPLAEYMRDKPHPFALAVGAERVVKDGRVQVKCDDGKWRYRSRVVWATVNGPIPHGYVIHHRNEDPMDDRLENLQMLTRAQHAAEHSTPEAMRQRQARTVAARKRNGTY